MKYIEEILKVEGDKIGIQIQNEHIQKFGVYLATLKEWNKKFNLTAINKDEEIVVKHFIDSLACILSIPHNLYNMPFALIDIGSGAGFPGLPLKIYFKNIKLTLLEASRKKSDFLKNISVYLGLENIEVLDGRAEEYGQDNRWREKYDLATARAVDSLPVLIEYALPFLKIGGIFIAQKGSAITEEINQAKGSIELLGGAIKDTQKYELQMGPEKIQRNLVVIKKIGFTPDKYPRRAGMPKKRPIK